ncbi:MAG: replication-relaxation family protein [Pseudobacteriovorax sp.]|nr:replication-relaxation family protein [Pseudobacteriovorax sp.]
MSKIIKNFISEKDIQAIKYLHTVKVATARQLNRDVYHYTHQRSVNRILKKLVDKDLIRGIYHSEFYPKRLYSATKKGFGKYVRDGYERRVQLQSNSIPHDIALGDIRARFLDGGIAKNYIAENELKCWQDFADSPEYFSFVQSPCDGVVEIDFPTGAVSFAVEYEASSKRLSSYTDIFSRYYVNNGIPFVIYIAGKSSVITRMVSHEKRHFSDKEPKIFYVLLEDFMTSNTIELTDRNGGILNLEVKKSNHSNTN